MAADCRIGLYQGQGAGPRPVRPPLRLRALAPLASSPSRAVLGTSPIASVSTRPHTPYSTRRTMVSIQVPRFRRRVAALASRIIPHCAFGVIQLAAKGSLGEP
jgi:hypothetical protein